MWFHGLVTNLGTRGFLSLAITMQFHEDTRFTVAGARPRKGLVSDANHRPYHWLVVGPGPMKRVLGPNQGPKGSRDSWANLLGDDSILRFMWHLSNTISHDRYVTWH